MDTNEEPCLQLAGRFFLFSDFGGRELSVGGESFIFLELLISAASLGVELPP